MSEQRMCKHCRYEYKAHGNAGGTRICPQAYYEPADTPAVPPPAEQGDAEEGTLTGQGDTRT